MLQVWPKKKKKKKEKKETSRHLGREEPPASSEAQHDTTYLFHEHVNVGLCGIQHVAVGVLQSLDRDVHGFAVYVYPPSCPWGQEQPETEENVSKGSQTTSVNETFPAAWERGLADVTQVAGAEHGPLLGDTGEFQRAVQERLLEARKLLCQPWECETAFNCAVPDVCKRSGERFGGLAPGCCLCCCSCRCFGCSQGMWMFPGQGLNLSCSSDHAGSLTP